MTSYSFKIMHILTIIIWIITIIPAGEALIESIKSMNGIGKFPSGEMIYGIDAFIETITTYTIFLFPLFLLWLFCLSIAIILTITLLLFRHTNKLQKQHTQQTK